MTTAARALDCLSETQIQKFRRDGYLIIPQLADASLREQMREITLESLDPARAPLEYETDVHYPGSPPSRSAEGGNTARRLLHAYTRHSLFRNWAKGPVIGKRLAQLLASEQLLVSQNHHNCIMTKYPGFSSATHWHQDIRYWSFDKPELVSVWLALGTENHTNGCLRVIPGSHKDNLDRGRFDAEYFFREDLVDNQHLLAQAIDVELAPGDALFFHCRLLHFAGRNTTSQPKFSLVFTYREQGNQPIPETRSARFPDIPVRID